MQCDIWRNDEFSGLDSTSWRGIPLADAIAMIAEWDRDLRPADCYYLKFGGSVFHCRSVGGKIALFYEGACDNAHD